MGTVVLSDRDERFIEAMRGALGRDSAYELVVAPTLGGARDAALESHAHVLVLGPSVAIDAALGLARELASASPPISVVLVAQRVTTELLKLALRAGLRDVCCAEEQSIADVAKSVREAHDAAISAREAAPSEHGAVPEREARVITVFGTKGGVGKSVLATNMGVSLASGGQRSVVILDLDLESGDVGIMLNLKPAHTILEAAQAADRLDAEMLKGLLLEHSSGLLALLAPVRPEDAELVTAARIGTIIDLLRVMADVVVIDTPGAMSEAVLTAIDKSDVLLAVSTLDMPSVKNTRVALQKLWQLGYRNGLIKLALNRADSKVLMDQSDVEQALGTHVFAHIPSDRLVPRSVNKGVPVVTDEPRSPVARSLSDLASAVLAGKEAT